MKKILLLLLLAPSVLIGAKVKIDIQAPEYAGHHVQLIRFTDLFTYTPELLSTGFVEEDGTVTLEGDIQNTEIALIRIDHVSAYIYLSPGAALKVVFPPLPEGMARSMGNTNFVELSFIDLPEQDPNRQLSLLSEKISAFYAEFITLQRVEDQKNAGRELEEPGEGLANDAPNRKKLDLKSEVDSLNKNIDKLFKAVSDPFILTEKEYAIGMLYWNLPAVQTGTNISKKWLFEQYFEKRPIHLNSPSWVDLFRNFYQDQFMLGPMFSKEVEFRKALEIERDPAAVIALLMEHDLVNDSAVAELLLINGIFEYYHSGRFEQKALRDVLDKLNKNASTAQVRKLASSILTDLTTLERYLPAPEFTLIDNDRNTITLEDYEGEYLYIGFWASWCSSCLKELGVMKKQFEQYGKFVQFLTINIDDDPYERAEALEDLDLPWTDLYHVNDPLILDRYRIRSAPQFFLIGPEGQILKAPAKRPSDGIAASFHRIKVAAQKNEQIKIWDD